MDVDVVMRGKHSAYEPFDVLLQCSLAQALKSSAHAAGSRSKDGIKLTLKVMCCTHTHSPVFGALNRPNRNTSPYE